MDYTNKQIKDWAYAAKTYGGGFIKAFGTVILTADSDNYPIIRPVAVQLIAKYPKYLEL